MKRGVATTVIFLSVTLLATSTAWGMSNLSPYAAIASLTLTDIGYNGYNIYAGQRVAVRIQSSEDVDLLSSQLFLMGTGYPHTHIKLTLQPEITSGECVIPDDQNQLAVTSLRAMVYSFTPFWYSVEWPANTHLVANTPYWIVAASSMLAERSSAWVEVEGEGTTILANASTRGWGCGSDGETTPGLQNEFNVLD